MNIAGASCPRLKKVIKPRRASLMQTVWLLPLLAVWHCSMANGKPASRPTLESSSQSLVNSFNWNKAKALSWVRTGVKPGYLPCYWAGYNYREAFYVRDIAHQCEGAALLGLNEENLSMWRALAGSANESRQWFCLWALDFYGKPYAVDYHSDTNFVRELPAPLELVDKALACYRWSGDPRWIGDPVLTNFYRTTMTEFISRHDDNGDGIAEGHAVGIFDGACGSYCEQSAHGYGVGGDNIATTWSAYNAYAELLSAMGKTNTAATFRDCAARVKSAYDRSWWNAGAGNYFAGQTIGLRDWITNFDQFSKETYYFQAVKGMAEPGLKADALLEKIHQNCLANRTEYNFESFTYLPEVFYNYGHNEQGWYWLKEIMDSHYNYPEVSFTAVEFVATGMMGVEPNAPAHRITTLPRLPAEVEWVQLDHIPLGTCDVMVRHEDVNRRTTVRNNTPDSTLVWEARLPGSFAQLYVDGVPQAAHQANINGVRVSWVEVELAAGQQKTVAARGSATHP